MKQKPPFKGSPDAHTKLAEQIIKYKAQYAKYKAQYAEALEKHTVLMAKKATATPSATTLAQLAKMASYAEHYGASDETIKKWVYKQAPTLSTSPTQTFTMEFKFGSDNVGKSLKIPTGASLSDGWDLETHDAPQKPKAPSKHPPQHTLFPSEEP